MKNLILTNDPSFTAWGYVVLTPEGVIVDQGCIKTEPEHKKKHIYVADDRVRRAREIVKTLLDIIRKYDIKLIISELPHGSQNAQAAVMIGAVMALLVAVAECLNIPAEFYNESDAKKTLLNKKSASKEEVIDAIDKIYNVKWSDTKYFNEAIADALAIHNLAKETSQLLKMFKNL